MHPGSRSDRKHPVLSRVAFGAAAEDSSLQGRIEQLEKQVADLKKEAATTPAPGPARLLGGASGQKETCGRTRHSDVRVRQRRRFYDTSRTNPGNFVLWVARRPPAETTTSSI